MTRRRPEGLSLRSVQSDGIRSDWREAIEFDRGVVRGVGAGGEKIDRVADREIERQLVAGMLVNDVGAVAGRPCENRRRAGQARKRGVNPIVDALTLRLRKTVVPARVE
jgi:hypothetical protein